MDWDTFALPHQRPPLIAANGEPWTTWLLIGGRGAGKTLAGAHWANRVAAARVSPIALVGETEHDVREVMIEGESGVLRACIPTLRPVWIPSRRRLVWPNGAYAQAFSAEDPESLRGPQFAAAWCDELAKWKYADATFDMLQFGLRLGDAPRQVITTTPRPTALIKRLIADPRTAVTRATTFANALNLAPTFFDTIVSRFMKPGAPIYVGEDVVKYFEPWAGEERRRRAAEAARERELEEERAELLALRREFEELRAQIEAERTRRALKAFNPNQPRVPAGNPDGGQWTSGDGGGRNDPRVLSDAIPDNLIKPGARLAQNDRLSGRPIDLLEERQQGGHTIERHVGRSHESLLREVREQAQDTQRRGDFAAGLREGSFPSLDAANKLVNSTLAENPTLVGQVVGGAIPWATVGKEFGSVTGYEAYARTERSQPYIRNATGVSVFILRDPSSSKGYRVHSAYPRNFDR